MFCRNCGNKLSEDEKFCSKCGYKIELHKQNKEDNNKIKKVFIVLTPILTIILLIVAILGRLYFYRKDVKIGSIIIENPMSYIGITDEYITNIYKMSYEISEYDCNTKILAIKNIDYKNFDKLAFIEILYNDKSTMALALIDTNNDNLQGFNTDYNINCLLDGIYNNNPAKANEFIKISVKYIENCGIEVFSNYETQDYKNLIKDISNIIEVERSREYVTSELKKMDQEQGMEYDYILLFEKESAFIKYLAIYVNGEYILYEMKDTGDIKVGAYKTLEEARENLNVD